MMRPEDRAAVIQQLRIERQEWARSLDPEAFDAYWRERAAKIKKTR